MLVVHSVERPHLRKRPGGQFAMGADLPRRRLAHSVVGSGSHSEEALAQGAELRPNGGFVNLRSSRKRIRLGVGMSSTPDALGGDLHSVNDWPVVYRIKSPENPNPKTGKINAGGWATTTSLVNTSLATVAACTFRFSPHPRFNVDDL